MTLLLSAAGVAALSHLDDRALLCFDFDGTLSPLVRDRAEARVPDPTAARMRALCRRWPVAVITGRRVDDVLPRLGFSPQHVFGNHGAETAAEPADKTGAAAWANSLDACRLLLHGEAAALHSRQIEVEDKGLSLALHYRCAGDPEAAGRWIAGLLASVAPAPHVTRGHCVLNVTALGAPDKGDALRSILGGHAACVFMIGDDINDEPAFAAAPPGSVTVRIGEEGIQTCARFTLLRQDCVDAVLDTLLAR